MRRIILVQTILLSLFAAIAVAQPGRELQGRVYHLGKDEEKVPETGIVVTCLETGSRDDTNDQGIFRLPLLALQPGRKVTLSIDKPGWRIRYPFEGEVVIPAPSGKEIISVEVLPVGSKLFWTDDRIENFIERAIEDAKRETSQEKKHTIDLNRYLKDWAIEYGFKPQDAQKEIDRWIAEVEKNHEGVYKSGLAAFAKKQFRDAARHFRDSADWNARQLKEAQQRQAELAEQANKWREGLIRDLRLEGDSYHQEGEYQKALASYQEAHDHTSRDETPELWAATLNDIGRTLTEQAAMATSSEAVRVAQLEQAIQAHHQALLIYTYEKFPKDWAGTLNDLGFTLEEQSKWTDEECSAQLLVESVQAYRQALLIYTYEKFPQNWAGAQMNLGSILMSQGSQTEGERGAQLFGESVEANRRALLVYSREKFPQDWIPVQINLCGALSEQGRRIEGDRGAQLLTESIEICRQALLVATREQAPQRWAGLQNNLGIALSALGVRTGGEHGAQLLAESVEAFRQTLLGYPSERFPREWAVMQSHLGSSLLDLGWRTQGERGIQLLGESVEAHHQALLVLTREQFPTNWASIQSDLGNALWVQSARTEGERGIRLLAESVEAYRQALLVYTREQFPANWARTQNHIGLALGEQGRRAQGEQGAKLFAEAVQAFRSASEIMTYEQFPAEWTSSKRNEVRALRLSARYEEAAQGLSEILSKSPDNTWAVDSLAGLLNNQLFDHHRSLSISQQWLARNPGDLEAKYREIEALFAIGAFADCQAKAESLQNTATLQPDQQAALLGYQVAAGMAVGSPGSAVALEKLIGMVKAQPSDFSIGFSYPGTLHALQDRSDLPRHDWLVRLFQALESQDRDSLLQRLRDLQ